VAILQNVYFEGVCCHNDAADSLPVEDFNIEVEDQSGKIAPKKERNK
jgi:hypothetical protein